MNVYCIFLEGKLMALFKKKQDAIDLIEELTEEPFVEDNFNSYYIEERVLC